MNFVNFIAAVYWERNEQEREEEKIEEGMGWIFEESCWENRVRRWATQGNDGTGKRRRGSNTK